MVSALKIVQVDLCTGKQEAFAMIRPVRTAFVEEIFQEFQLDGGLNLPAGRRFQTAASRQVG
jgi:hypothetical protein